jgi:hypothetical protein
MRNRILAGAVAAVVVTAGLAGAAGAATAGTTTEHISIVSTSSTSRVESIILTGAFTTGGIDISGNKVDKVRVQGGTFKIAHKGTDKFSIDPGTCLATITGPGTYKILDGTGAYKGINGHGKYKLSITEVAPRTSTGACSQTANPLAYQFRVTAHGPVSLP